MTGKLQAQNIVTSASFVCSFSANCSFFPLVTAFGYVAIKKEDVQAVQSRYYVVGHGQTTNSPC